MMKTTLLVLLTALRAVESSNGLTAHNQYQIRDCCVQDVNRIYGTTYTMHDAYDRRRSEEIALLYLDYWGREYQKAVKKAPDYEVYARIWNGGPDGWKKESTKPYWKKVRRQIICAESQKRRSLQKSRLR